MAGGVLANDLLDAESGADEEVVFETVFSAGWPALSGLPAGTV